MRTRELNDSEMDGILQRADEIAREGIHVLDPQAAYAPYLDAAEEMGIPREAVIYALEERLRTPLEPIRPGARVFAMGADGAFYAARIESIDKLRAQVWFANGSAHTCSVTHLRPFGMIPGRRFEVFYRPWSQWIPASVQKYSEECEMADVVYCDGERSTVALHEIRLPGETVCARTRFLCLKLSNIATYGGLAAAAFLLYVLFAR
jgi:hypothetical protein